MTSPERRCLQLCNQESQAHFPPSFYCCGNCLRRGEMIANLMWYKVQKHHHRPLCTTRWSQPPTRPPGCCLVLVLSRGELEHQQGIDRDGNTTTTITRSELLNWD